MKTFRLMLVVAFAFCLVSSLAYAEDHARKGVCKADYEKFCKDVKPGDGRIIRCMLQHENELSQGCRDQIAAAREKEEAFVKACKPDAAKLCKGVKPGHGRIIKCLKANEAQLSPDCGAYFKK